MPIWQFQGPLPGIYSGSVAYGAFPAADVAGYSRLIGTDDRAGDRRVHMAFSEALVKTLAVPLNSL